MKFNGQSSVEVHPHSNVEELKTVTSISLFIRVDPDKDPIEDRFILYLGDRSVSWNAERRRGLLEKTNGNSQWKQMGAITLLSVGVWSQTSRLRPMMKRLKASLWRVNILLVAVCGGRAVRKSTFKAFCHVTIAYVCVYMSSFA